MNRNKLFALILASLMVLALAVPALAQDTEPVTEAEAETTQVAPAREPLTASTDLFVTTQFRVNVRSGPGLEYTILDVITFGDSLDITGQNEAGTWLRVNFNGREGWVSANVVQVEGLVENAPVVEPGEGAVLQSAIVQQEAETTTEDTGPVEVMTRFNTNLRSSFSIQADVLDVVPFNTELIPEGRTDNNNWLQVTFGDQSGWIYAPILAFTSGQVETLPVLATVPEAAPATGTTSGQTDEGGDSGE